jgi:Ca2+-binding RTX toxin-like protein
MKHALNAKRYAIPLLPSSGIGALSALLAVLLLTALFSAKAFAQEPASCLSTEAGQTRYNAGFVEFCNGSYWLPMGNTASAGACANAGQMAWSGTEMQSCDGADLQSLNCYTKPFTSCTTAGETRYNDNDFQYCDGSEWVYANQYLCTNSLIPCGGWTTGDDNIDCTGSGEFIDALAGNDTIGAQGGDDFILGSDGNDIINDGNGADTVYAGAGDDILRFNWTNNAATGNTFVVLDGGPGTDTLDASDDNGRVALPLTFSQVSNSIEVITDFTGANNQLEDQDDVANIWDFSAISLTASTKIYSEGGADSISGSSVGDIIYGGDGNDTIHGNGGDDIIRPGGDVDAIYGGDGDDTFQFDWTDNDEADMTAIDGGSGTDTARCIDVNGEISLPATFSLAGNSIENIYDCTASNNYLFDAADRINTWDFTGISMTNDTNILGMGGADTITSGASALSVYLGAGEDTLVYANESNVGGDTVIDGSTGVSDTVHLNFTTGVSTTLDSWLIGNNFEYLDISNTVSTDSVNVTVGSISSPTSLYVKGDPEDDVWSLDSVTRGANINMGGDVFALYTNGSGSLYVLYGMNFNGSQVCNPAATTGNDNITCGDGSSTLDLLAGNDTLNAGGGDDIITGGPGADTINAGAGDDTIIYNAEGEVGLDTSVDGGSGTDTVWFNFTTDYNSVLDGFFTNVEYLDFTNSAQDRPRITISSINGTWYIKGDTGGNQDDIEPQDSYTHVSGGDVNVGGIDYGAFTSGGDTMYVQFGLAVDGTTVVANP